MPLSILQLQRNFGNFSYTEDHHHAGAIKIDPHWVRGNIVKLKTRFGTFRCHKNVFCQMKGLVFEADACGLIHDIGGIWVPRHIMWDRDKPLSGHAFGCEIDINVQQGRDGSGGDINYGDNSYQPPMLINIAQGWGFEWGGSWRHSKDGMHFSCIRIGAKRLCDDLLRLGSQGNLVKFLQLLLNYDNDNSLSVDGIFGRQTNGALLSYQKKQGLAVDGIVGPKTWNALLTLT